MHKHQRRAPKGSSPSFSPSPSPSHSGTKRRAKGTTTQSITTPPDAILWAYTTLHYPPLLVVLPPANQACSSPPSHPFFSSPPPPPRLPLLIPGRTCTLSSQHQSQHGDAKKKKKCVNPSQDALTPRQSPPPCFLPLSPRLKLSHATLLRALHPSLSNHTPPPPTREVTIQSRTPPLSSAPVQSWPVLSSSIRTLVQIITSIHHLIPSPPFSLFSFPSSPPHRITRLL